MGIAVGRRERKKEEMRQRILDIAVGLFERDGFEAVTMEGIAEQADVAKATLYSYFPLKEAMLTGWMQRHTAGVAERVAPLLREVHGTRARLKALFGLLREPLETQRSLVEHYILFRLSSKDRFCGDQSLRSGIAGVLRRILAQGQNDGEIRRDLTPGELTTYLESLFLSTLMMAWFVPGGEADLGKRLDEMQALFLEGAGGCNEA